MGNIPGDILGNAKNLVHLDDDTRFLTMLIFRGKREREGKRGIIEIALFV